jgi:hypothetical protein
MSDETRRLAELCVIKYLEEVRSLFVSLLTYLTELYQLYRLYRVNQVRNSR